MTGALPAPVQEAFEELKAAARVRVVGVVVEIRCSGRGSSPCGLAERRLLEALIREAPDVRLIAYEGEHDVLRALGCSEVADLTWEVPRSVDVDRLRDDVLYLGGYMLTAGDRSVTRMSLPRGDLFQKGWFERLLAETTVTFCLSADADDDPWWVGVRAAPEPVSTSE
jgi:hypothetical protein